MTRTTHCIFLAAILCVGACGNGTEEAVRVANEEAPITPQPVTSRLEHPFRAEQIHDEWVEGFRLEVRRWTPEAEAFEEWTVVGADDEGVDIESVVFNGEGAMLTEPSIQRSTWVELRDHASFPAELATREAVTRDTPLGELDGWLYVVGDPSGETVTEFFFAESHPGAPVTVHVIKDGEVVEIFEQIERTRP